MRKLVPLLALMVACGSGGAQPGSDGASLGQWQNAVHDKVGADPGFAAIPDINGADVPASRAVDFTPKPTSQLLRNGIAGPGLPTTDFFGTPRGSAPTIGAIE